MRLTNEMMYYVFFVICVFGIQGKPSYTFNFPSIGRFLSFGQEREAKPVLKVYSGRRVKNDSIRMVYFYDQTVAVVELEPTKLLLNCELIEVYEPELAIKALGEIQHISKPVGISFQEMLKLMNDCKELEEAEQARYKDEHNHSYTETKMEARGILANNPFTLLSGIIPGTKWCGTGDIAKDYFDLGTDAATDSCCRAHDLCPVKIRSYSSRYNLTNNSYYTKSHCICDDQLFNCLKSTTSPTANILGNLYFNLVQIPCVADTKKGRVFRKGRNNF
ncbi:uncharacterized protein LOC109608709 [Aethina tumida]|uniref:uncharacterized protein LOC109608709 n=1 Tax=Aethina tumida TaxID=116153 RepID=UPI00096AE818|nr:uncharacterized protein LOC109608709 [Aethina tumida]